MKERIASYLRIIGKVLLKAASAIVVFGELLFITMISSGKWSNVYKKRNVSLTKMVNEMEQILGHLIVAVVNIIIVVVCCILLSFKYFAMYVRHFVLTVFKKEGKLKNPIVFWKECWSAKDI